MFGVTLPDKQGRDVYYKELNKVLPENFNEEFDLGDIEHFWEEFDKLSEADKAVVSNQIGWLMEHTANEMEKMKPGSTPGEIAAMIKLKKEPARFDWKKFIRLWVGNSQEVYTKQSRFKPNPYFPGTPSSKIKLKQNILCAIDTSGSVSEKELEEFMSEIYNLWKFGHTITILCADTTIYEPYIYKGQSDIKIHGRGGTYFTPVINWFNERPEYSTMLYFTDSYAECPPDTIRPMMWIISSSGDGKAIEQHNGKKLFIKPQ